MISTWHHVTRTLFTRWSPVPQMWFCPSVGIAVQLTNWYCIKFGKPTPSKQLALQLFNFSDGILLFLEPANMQMNALAENRNWDWVKELPPNCFKKRNTALKTGTNYTSNKKTLCPKPFQKRLVYLKIAWEGRGGMIWFLHIFLIGGGSDDCKNVFCTFLQSG